MSDLTDAPLNEQYLALYREDVMKLRIAEIEFNYLDSIGISSIRHQLFSNCWQLYNKCLPVAVTSAKNQRARLEMQMAELEQQLAATLNNQNLRKKMNELFAKYKNRLL